ncbi:MAG: outer membrane beta-barrel protein [Flavisolibacter sp.]
MRSISTVIALMILHSSFAQDVAIIRGKVQDENGRGLPAATVSLLQVGDSSLLKMGVANASGQFEIAYTKQGQYLLSASAVGFQKTYSKEISVTPSAAVDVPALTLSPVSGEMAGVVVQARKPLIETKIDKLVVNVDAAPTNAGANALEVLEKSPGVSVDRDGNISLRGKQGIIVLMDGKQTYLSGSDLANLLRNMPASELNQIEIMTQPSAKFDAAGNAGVINLRTKKSLLRGFNGSINLSYVQGRYPKSPNSFTFNYRNAKINFFSSLGYSRFQNFNDQYLTRTFRSNGQVTSVFDQKADQVNTSENYNARLGLDYNLDNRTTLGVVVNGNYSPRNWLNNGRADIINGTGGLDSFNVVQSENKDKWKNFGVNFNFRRVLPGSGHELTADVDQIRYFSRSRQTSDNYNYFPSGALSGDPFLLRGYLPSDITIYSGKVDYVRPLPRDAKLELGAKSSYVETDNDAQYTRYNANQQQWEADNGRSNHFIYKENINAAYASLGRQVGKWGFQAGLRMENTIAKGDQLGNAVQKDSSFTRNYTQLFPTAFISCDANENNKLGLNYGRRIERPNYQDMNPFQYFLDQYTYRQGNPTLTPQFTHNIELSHVYKGALNTTLSYTYTTDILNDILKQNDETRVTYQIKENVAKRQVWGLTMTYNKSLTGWWTTSVFANVNYNRYEGIVNNHPLEVQMTTFTANSSQVFRFAKTWTGELSGFYRSTAQETGMFVIRPMGVFSVGLGKQLLQNKANVKINVYDPFYIQKAKVDIRFGNIDAFVKNQWDNRRAALSFTYRFSKGQNAQGPRRRTGSSQEEQSRVGQ